MKYFFKSKIESWCRFILLLTPVLFVGCCNEDEPDPEPASNHLTVDVPVQFSAVISNDQIDEKEFENNITEAVSTRSNYSLPPDYVSRRVYECMLQTGVFPFTPTASVRKGGLLFDSNSPTSEQFVNFFQPGKYQYGTDEQHGFEISWYDMYGERWTSNYNFVTQPSSNIEIVETLEYYENGTQWVKVMIRFDCFLYNEWGSSKRVSDGLIVADFNNI